MHELKFQTHRYIKHDSRGWLGMYELCVGLYIETMCSLRPKTRIPSKTNLPLPIWKHKVGDVREIFGHKVDEANSMSFLHVTPVLAPDRQLCRLNSMGE